MHVCLSAVLGEGLCSCDLSSLRACCVVLGVHCVTQSAMLDSVTPSAEGKVENRVSLTLKMFAAQPEQAQGSDRGKKQLP